jgi:voltage-gated potassium channel
MRIWIAVEHAPYVHSRGWHARIKYVTSPIGVVDLLAVLPFWLMLVLPAELKVLLVFRVVRFLKLARYSPGMRSLLEVLYVERRALFGCSVILTGAALMAATVMHVLERHVQPDKFGTIPDAMWWAIVTLGTIGYGDVVPITPLGRVVAGATIFTGLIMVALPVGIVATAFVNEIHGAISSSPGACLLAFPCFQSSTLRKSPTSCGCFARGKSRPVRCWRGGASRHIRCISWPPARWRSS